MINRETTPEYHYPGMNYMGPGTHILTKIRDGVQPVNQIDEIALHHDLDYLRANDNYWQLITADVKAMKQADLSLPGIAMVLGLSLRSVLSTLTFNQFNFSGNSPKLTTEELKFLDDYVAEHHTHYA